MKIRTRLVTAVAVSIPLITALAETASAAGRASGRA